jgi:hypothetical protein
LFPSPSEHITDGLDQRYSGEDGREAGRRAARRRLDRGGWHEAVRFGFQHGLLPLAVAKRMGIIGVKVTGRGRILSTWTPPPVERQQKSWKGVVIANGPWWV